MSTSLDSLAQKLFAETDGGKFSKLKDRLIRACAGSERKSVLRILMDYSATGRMLHWRNFLLTDILELVHEAEIEYRPFFEWTLSQPNLAYWGLDGLLKTSGRQAYNKLVELAAEPSQPTELRAKAVKSLAVHSGQRFDRALTEDPGYWKTDDLRIDELQAWQADGFPDGPGYAKPRIHPSLLAPRSPLEKVAARLNKKLEAEREENQDLANPSNWLTMADEASIAAINQRWKLPEKYCLFLERYSPLNVQLHGKAFTNGLNLYGATDLIKAQEGYAFNAVTGERISDWPAGFVVIADDGADPFCIDTQGSVDGDAPIYTALHGTGSWNFEKYAGGFLDFLKRIVRK